MNQKQLDMQNDQIELLFKQPLEIFKLLNRMNSRLSEESTGYWKAHIEEFTLNLTRRDKEFKYTKEWLQAYTMSLRKRE